MPASIASFDALAHWLTEGPPQQSAGAHAGAVAGSVDENGRAEYVYPEITGYYLQWLGWMSARESARDALSTRAQAAQRWLRRWIETKPEVPTRIYLTGGVVDWRNDATFTFDVAMALRGVATAHRLGLIVADMRLVDSLCNRLSRLIAADSELDACRRHRTNDEFPQRWSTRRGAFLAKAAAGILDAAATFSNVPRELIDAAERTFIAAIGRLIHETHAETHPFLYGVEGFLSMPHRRDFAVNIASVAARFDALMDEVGRRGAVPEARIAEGQPRLDVVAQALRALVVLSAHRKRLDKPEQRTLLVDTLIRHVSPAGALPFAAQRDATRFNTWTTMFAQQALALAASPSAEASRFAAAPCIV